MARKIHIDLDHVVADFNSHYKTISGFDWDNNMEAHARWAPLIGKEEFFFLNLPAYEGAVEFVNEITQIAHICGFDVGFLTAVPSLHPFPTSYAEKEQWVIDKLGSPHKVAFGPFAKDKAKHCKPGDILIDDNPLNIEQWQAAGGIGILHTDLALSLAVLRAVLKEELKNA